MTIESERTIQAPVEAVWALTVDIERWPEITPTVTSVERKDDGPLRVGSSAVVDQPGQKPAVWTVTKLEAPNVFEWKTKVGGVTMLGTHHLHAAEGGATRNHLALHLSGFGSGLAGKLLGKKIQQAIDTENDGFKRVAESSEP